ncbi:DUF3093 domain-containing protein [Psychromicrobium xiongbiense]|uniref:DUF3093 domain-containing protein n=1 Tax=Psychromicrobium xiongbiense TaxID=3051184 RepID=UPI002556E1AC|nr:DUF3093 domain-containing protein [Psychromicrobium sp. YIM S02556]
MSSAEVPSSSATPSPADSPRSTATIGGIEYSEKLWPTVWIWLVVVLLSSAGILILAPISIFAGYTAAVVLLILQVGFLLLSMPRIVVDADTLTVGRARIERQYVGAVQGYRGEEAAAQRGPKLHGLAYLCLRGWVSPVVRIDITDPQDRTPYWLTSTRRPEQLVAVLTASH